MTSEKPATKINTLLKNKHAFRAGFFLLALLINFAVYGNILKNGFLSLDDNDAVVKNPMVTDLQASVKTLNPKFILTAVIYKYNGLNPAVFHLSSILMHTINVFLAFMILEKLSGRKIAVISALLFAVHPANSEAVCWFSGNAYLYSTMFTLLSAYFFILYRKENTSQNISRKKSLLYLIISCLIYFYYVISMKTAWAAVVPVLITAIDLFLIGTKPNYKKIIPVLMLFLIAAVYFVLIFPKQYSERKTYLAEDSIGTTPISRPLTVGRNLYRSITLLTLPFNLSVVAEIFEPTALSIILIIFSYALIAFLFFYTFKKDKIIFGLIACIYVQILPLFSPVDIAANMADRYFYGSVVFYTTLVTILIVNTANKYKLKTFTFPVIFVLLFIYSLVTFIRTFDWRDDRSIWTSAMKVSPENYKIYNELGNVSYRENDIRGALGFYEKAIKIRPDYPIVYHNIGLAFLKAGDTKNAKTFFEKSIALNPRFCESYYRLGQIAFLENDAQKSELFYTKALSINPAFSPAIDELNKIRR